MRDRAQHVVAVLAVRRALARHEPVAEHDAMPGDVEDVSDATRHESRPPREAVKSASVGIAQILFFIFLVVFLVTLLLHLMRGRTLPPV